ncbi:hypothetical protein CLV32_2443 [Pedobacter duraquae]|uniref:Uncharacterized protein n=2 Tax=Pedobacter duraquae TaxID=425511 RepID=A0A4R6IHE8_9SPHI|nr:hypothetical protein CLV32_2443 [Pedobacter duraquae]
MLFLIFLIPVIVDAQQDTLMKQPGSGRYLQGSTAGIDIYDDGTFALYGYATLLWGKYTLEHNNISFVPDVPKQPFVMLGRKNTSIKKGIKLTFAGSFNRNGLTYVKFDAAEMMRVFAEGYPTGESSFTKQIAYRPETLTLAENYDQNFYQFNTNSFKLPVHFNDFLLYYAAGSSEQRPFEGTLETIGDTVVLDTRWGKFEKQTEVKDVEWDTYMKRSKKEKSQEDKNTVFYFNDQLKSATGVNYLTEEPSIFDIKNYTLDPASNKFIRKDIYKKGVDYTKAKVADYHDERYMLSYERVPLTSQSATDFVTGKKISKALFVNKVSSRKKVGDEPVLIVPVTVEPPVKIMPTKGIPPESGNKN